MASGPMHYRRAEQALAHSHEHGITPIDAGLWLRAAEIHTRLAELALYATDHIGGGDADDWREVLGQQPAAEPPPAAEPLVLCGAPHPDHAGVTCTLPNDHLEGWPDPELCEPHVSMPVSELDVARCWWWDAEHPDPSGRQPSWARPYLVQQP